MSPRPAPSRTPSTTKRMIVMLILATLLLGGLFAVKAMMSAGMNQFFDNMPQPAVAVTATEAVQRQWPQTLEAVGTLVAVNSTDVTSESPGVVSAIRFESGQRVRKGDVLVQLDASAENATLRSLEAALKLALTQRDRYRELFSTRQAVAKADLDQRESEAERLQADVGAQRALIARKTIRAPFDGVLGIRKINLGQYLNPGDAIVNLQTLDPVFLNFTLPEQDVGKVAVGQPVAVTVDALPDRRFAGTISAIESQVDASTRNFLVQATLANPDEALRLEDLLAGLGKRVFGMLLVIAAIPAFIPVPGLAGAISGPLTVIVGVQLLLGMRRPWLPRFLARRGPYRHTLVGFERRISPLLARIERRIRPRLSAVLDYRPAAMFTGLLVVLLGILLALPIPFTNYLFGAMMMAFALALLERDGALMLVCWGVGIVAIVVFGVLSGALAAAATQWIGGLLA